MPFIHCYALYHLGKVETDINTIKHNGLAMMRFNAL